MSAIPNTAVTKAQLDDLATKANAIPALERPGSLSSYKLPYIFQFPCFQAGSEAEMLSGKAEAERSGFVGQYCIRTDLKKAYRPIASPTTRLSNWRELTNWLVRDAGDALPNGVDGQWRADIDRLLTRRPVLYRWNPNYVRWSRYAGWLSEWNELRERINYAVGLSGPPQFETDSDGELVAVEASIPQFWKSAQRVFVGTGPGIGQGTDLVYRFEDDAARYINVTMTFDISLFACWRQNKYVYPTWREVGFRVKGAVGYQISGWIIFSSSSISGGQPLEHTITGPYIEDVERVRAGYSIVKLGGTYTGGKVVIRCTINNPTNEQLIYSETSAGHPITLTGVESSQAPCDVLNVEKACSEIRITKDYGDLAVEGIGHTYDEQAKDYFYYWSRGLAYDVQYVASAPGGVFLAKPDQLSTFETEPWHRLVTNPTFPYSNLAPTNRDQKSIEVEGTTYTVSQSTQFITPRYPIRRTTDVPNRNDPGDFQYLAEGDAHPLRKGSVIWEVYVRRNPTRKVGDMMLLDTALEPLAVSIGCLRNGSFVSFNPPIELERGEVEKRVSVEWTIFSIASLAYQCGQHVNVQCVCGSTYSSALVSLGLPAGRPYFAVPLLAKSYNDTVTALDALAS